MSVKLGFVAGTWTGRLPGTMTFYNGPLGMLIRLQNNGLTMTGGKSTVRYLWFGNKGANRMIALKVE